MGKITPHPLLLKTPLNMDAAALCYKLQGLLSLPVINVLCFKEDTMKPTVNTEGLAR